jgi:hypothetical protein
LIRSGINAADLSERPMQEIFNREFWKWLQSLENSAQNSARTFTSNSHSNRLTLPALLPSAFPVGATFFEVDRGVFYFTNGTTWQYAGGIMVVPQAQIPADLGAPDTGFLVNVTDFGHLLRWTGTAWTWGPGDAGSGEIQGFLVDPAGPGWHICNGSTVSYLKQDGTLGSVTLPDYSTSPYLKFSTALAAGPTAASGSTAAVSGGIPSGTNSAPAFAGTFTGTPGNTGNESADTANVAVTGATSVAAAPHTHPFTPAGTIAGTVAAPVFSGNALAPHSHGPGTLDLRNTQLKAWFRQ